jgi:hypothetical protein
MLAFATVLSLNQIHGLPSQRPIAYSNTTIHRLIFTAEGFKWKHPHGAIISGTFSKLVKALEVVRDDGGDEMEREDFLRELRTAIVARCGNISGFADSNLI